MPWTIIAEANVHTARSVVSGHEPPDARVVIPSRLDEDIVHTFHHAVPVHPNVLTISVGPVPIDPDPLRTKGDRLLHHDGSRCWRCGLRGRDGLGLLNDDDGLTVDLLGRPGLGLDDHVGSWVVGLAYVPLSHVAIV